MKELIDRLVKAYGPDRELDADIAVALFGGEVVWKQANYTMESYPARRHANKNYVGGFCNEYVPLCTASIDEAISLIPNGYKWKLGYSRYVPHVAELVDYENDSGSFVGECDSSRAIAICIASLRARAAVAKATANGAA